MSATAADGRTAARFAGLAVSLAGFGFVAAGIWARREVRATLARERIPSVADGASANGRVTTGSAARSLAEVIRGRTVEAAGGRTYAETELFLGADGNGTSDAENALRDERSGQPVEHPDHALWLQSTTVQTALMQAYIGSRIADLTVGLGAAFVAAGAGLAAVGSGRG